MLRVRRLFPRLARVAVPLLTIVMMLMVAALLHAQQTQPAAVAPPAPLAASPADAAKGAPGAVSGSNTGADPGAPDSAAGPVAPKTNVVDLFFKGGIFMYPLALASIVSVAIIIERLFSLRRGNVIPRGFMLGLKNVLRDPREDRERALEYCQRHDSPIARMVAAGIKRFPRGIVATEKAIEDAGGNEGLKLRRNMRFLYALGSVATLLGLIGTISGMIKAFQVAAVSGVGRVDQLSTGIYEAMVNTFGGLAVAIVVTVFYYLFVGRIERLVSELNDELGDFADSYGLEGEPHVQSANTL